MALVVTNESLAAGMLPVVMPIGVTSDEVIAATASGVYDVSRDAANSASRLQGEQIDAPPTQTGWVLRPTSSSGLTCHSGTDTDRCRRERLFSLLTGQ
ncbi:MAG TPA: hypothetical protein VG815_19130 [Chloroflexota bacterium]|nr:hypothetical protein [Chloroflexota bacterium]